MSGPLLPLRERLQAAGALDAQVARENEVRGRVPAAKLVGACAVLIDQGARLAALYGDDLGDTVRVTALLALDGSLVALDADLDPADPRYPALTPRIPAAHWYERALHDMFGIVPEDHPWLMPLVLHEEWAGAIHPLRAAFARGTVPGVAGGIWAPPPVAGDGVFDIPYGPVRSGVFEAAQFLVRTAGEDILTMVPRLFYKHRGIEKLFPEVPLNQGVLVAEHAAGVAAVAHALAFCQAVERALGIAVPPRAAALRVVYAELERLHNHLDSLLRQCETASLSVGQAQFAMLKERVLRLNADLVGNRFLRGTVCLGGVRQDLLPGRRDMLRAACAQLERDVAAVTRLFLATTSMRDRLIGTGRLPLDTAHSFGAVGPVARGSGIEMDVRLDRPYAAYDRADVEVQVQRTGDAMARTRVRIGEIENSLAIVREIAEDLPAGPLVGEGRPTAGEARAVGWAEAPQGEVIYAVRFGADGRLARCAVRSPSFCNWSFYERTMPRNVLTDVGFIEHSFNLSVAGCDG